MNDLSQSLKIGDLLVIEVGEYSDRGWYGPIRMLVNSTKQELADSYLKEWTKEDSDLEWRDEPDPDGFLPWLVKTKRAEHVDCTSWHVGSYSKFEP